MLAPSLFTMGNMACGFYSLIASHLEDFNSAGIAIFLGIVFDMLDGRIARMVHGESPFGVEFDSLSDFLTFGVAPAYMMWSFILKDSGIWGGIAAFVFALAGGLRLARFNVVAQSGKGSKTHFQGLPIPAGAMVLAAIVVLYGNLEQPASSRPMNAEIGELLSWLIVLGPVLMIFLAGLMVSTLPYPAFKQAGLFRKKDVRLLAILIAALALIYFYPQNTIFFVSLAYVFSGLFGLLGRRRRDEAESPPTHDGLA